MLQQLQQQLQQTPASQPNDIVMQVPCLGSGGMHLPSATRTAASSAAAMAALLKVASSETQGGKQSTLRTSHLMTGTKPWTHALITTSAPPSGTSDFQAAASDLSAGVHGSEVTDGALWLPQLCSHTAKPASSMASDPPGSRASASELLDMRSDFGRSNNHRDGPQHAFVTGGLGALGQLLAIWLKKSEGVCLSLAGRSGRASMEADGAADSGQLPLWAQCVQDVSNSAPAVRMVRCDAAAREESINCLRVMEGATPAVDCIFHAGR